MLRYLAIICFFPVLLLLVVLPISSVRGQGITHDWSQRFGAGNDEGAVGVVDRDGNVIITGNFKGTVDFGGGPLTSGCVDTCEDILVAKYDASGNHLWSRNFGDAELICCTGTRGTAVAVDSEGSVFVTGTFEDSVDFGGGSIVGSQDIFLVKFDSGGNHVWSLGFGNISNDAGYDIAVDTSGNVLVTGCFSLAVDFGGGPMSSAGSSDIFVAKFSTAGEHIWSYGFGLGGVDIGSGIAVDGAGNVVITGIYQGPVDFGGGPLDWDLFEFDMYLAKFDSNGDHLWSKGFGEADTGGRVAVDGLGNIILAGGFLGSIDFGGGLMTSAGVTDIFVARFRPGGDHAWSKRFGDTLGDIGTGLSVDASGSIFVTGRFAGTADFGGGSMTSDGSKDVFVAKYNANGTHVWSDHYGTGSYDWGPSVTTDSCGGVVLIGVFEDSVDFGGGALTSAGNADIFMARYVDSTIVTSVGTTAASPLVLEQNHPNPFNPVTTIAYSVAREEYVTLRVYDITGRLVTTLINGRVVSGSQSVEWDGSDSHGKRVASGIYFYRLTAGNRVYTKKMVLLK